MFSNLIFFQSYSPILFFPSSSPINFPNLIPQSYFAIIVFNHTLPLSSFPPTPLLIPSTTHRRSAWQ
jgi:hypothetical protein